jgi:hypothetical protein
MEAAGTFPGLGKERGKFRERFNRDLRERRGLR